MDYICKVLNFSTCFAVDSNGTQGGLALLWKRPIKVRIIQFTDRFITAKVQIPVSNDVFIFIGLYGEPRMDKCLNFWNYFTDMHFVITDSWVMLGRL